MDKFFKNFDWKAGNVLKIAGIALAAIVVIAVAVSLFASSFRVFTQSTSGPLGKMASNFSMQPMMEEMAYDGRAESYGRGGGVDLSVRNVTGGIVPPYPGTGTTGDDVEEYEVTSYSASVETRRLQDTCSRVIGLKAREDVIFENSNESEKYCNYTFKVKSGSVAEILSLIEQLDPKDLNENTYTIKNIVQDYTSEVEILENKMASIEKTLADAIEAYDDITQLAVDTQDAESLAKIIDSKINIIERLTREKINITAQLDRLSRSKAEQLDRLDYTYFNVNIYENKFVDGDDIKDSWKLAVKEFVQNLNKIVQDISINLVAIVFLAIQYIIYFLIVVIIIKYLWRITKKIWKA